jgi:hypothetical protein
MGPRSYRVGRESDHRRRGRQPDRPCPRSPFGRSKREERVRRDGRPKTRMDEARREPSDALASAIGHPRGVPRGVGGRQPGRLVVGHHPLLCGRPSPAVARCGALDDAQAEARAAALLGTVQAATHRLRSLRRVRAARQRGLTWEKAYAAASEALALTPSFGSPAAMKKSYRLVSSAGAARLGR